MLSVIMQSVNMQCYDAVWCYAEYQYAVCDTILSVTVLNIITLSVILFYAIALSVNAPWVESNKKPFKSLFKEVRILGIFFHYLYVNPHSQKQAPIY